MSIATKERVSPPQSSTPAAKRSYRLNASAYEQVASGLLSALLFVGTVVGALLLLYFSIRMSSRQAASVPVTSVELEGDGGDGGTPKGSGNDVNEPPGNDVPPELVQQAPVESVEKVTEAVSSRAAQFDDAALDTQFTPGKGKGGTGGTGRRGKKGPVEQIPRAQRWVIHFEGGNLKTYVQQLDFFGIELGTVGGPDNLVHYAFHLAKPKPDHRTGSPDSENRLYMTWRSGPLQAADRELLAKAGIDVSGRVMMQFYPKQTEDMLAKLEKERAGNRDINDIRRTVFDVRSLGGGKFEFVVASQLTF